jgi:hypothetical protein
MPESLRARHWRERAEEARTLAAQMNDGDARRPRLVMDGFYAPG